MIGDKHAKVVLRQTYLVSGIGKGVSSKYLASIHQVSHSSFLTSEKSL